MEWTNGRVRAVFGAYPFPVEYVTADGTRIDGVNGEDRLGINGQEFRLSDMQIQEVADGFLMDADGYRLKFAISMDEASRPSTLWRMQCGAAPVRIYHEADQRFYLYAYRSSSEQWLILASDSKNTSEVRIVPAHEPAADWQLLARRYPGHKYHVDHGPQGLLIRSNDIGENFALYRADPVQPLRNHWELLVDVDSQRTLEEVSVQQQGLLLHYREDGLARLEVHPAQGQPYPVSMPDTTYSLHVQGGEE